MSNWIVDAVGSMGYWGIALLMFLENVVPPIPSELIMPLAGYLTTKGQSHLWGVVLAGVVGSVAGQTWLHAIARKMGERRVRDWVDRHGSWAAVSGDEIDRAAKWFQEHGGWAVLFGRLVPGLRSLVSIPAGLAEMSLPKFLACTTVGTTLWTGILAVVGRWLGSQFGNVERYLSPVSWVILGLAVAAYVYRVLSCRRKASASTQMATSR